MSGCCHKWETIEGSSSRENTTKLRSIYPWIASLLQVNPQNCRVLAFVEMWIYTPYFENKPFVKLVPKVIFRFDKDK